MTIKDFRDAVEWNLAVLAGLGSAMAIISAIVHLGDIGLEATLQVLVGYYRSFLSPLYDLVTNLPIVIPSICVDFLIPFLIGITINFRLLFGIAHVERTYKFPPNLRKSRTHLIVPFSPWLITTLLSYRKQVEIRFRHGRPQSDLQAMDTLTLSLIRKVFLSIALIPLSVILFFIYNAFPVT